MNPAFLLLLNAPVVLSMSSTTAVIRRLGEQDPPLGQDFPDLAVSAVDTAAVGTVLLSLILSADGIPDEVITSLTIPGLPAGIAVRQSTAPQYVTGTVWEVYVSGTLAVGTAGPLTATGDDPADNRANIQISIVDCATLDPSILRPDASEDALDVRDGLVTASYTTGTPTGDAVRDGVSGPDGCLRPGAVTAGGELRPGWVSP